MYGIRDTLKYFYPDYQNYYYLPEEDMVIHKSIADSVDPSYRKKATKTPVIQKKQESFFPRVPPGSIRPSIGTEKIKPAIFSWMTDCSSSRSCFMTASFIP